MLYACGFTYLTPMLSPMLGIYNLEIYDFEFHASGGLSKKDERISATIIAVLDEFFVNTNRILIYACDSADGRAKQRQALVRKWHENMNSPIDRQELEIDTGHGQAYGCILTRKDFEHKDVLQNELVDKARGIIVEKFNQ